METREVIKLMMKEQGITQTDLAERIGKKQGNVAMYLKNADSMRLDNLVMLANACGYDVALVNRSNPGQMYVLGNEEAPLPLMGMPAVPATPVQPMAEKTETQEELIRRIVQDELRKAGVV